MDLEQMDCDPTFFDANSVFLAMGLTNAEWRRVRHLAELDNEEPVVYLRQVLQKAIADLVSVRRSMPRGSDPSPVL